MLAFNINACGARDAEWPMGEQVRHMFGQELCRFDIECQEALLHGTVILYENPLQPPVGRACSEGAGIAKLAVEVRWPTIRRDTFTK